MAEELDVELNQPSESQQRITQLSKDKKASEEARAAAEAKAQEAEAKAAEAQRVAEFSEGFVDVVANNPAAKDHKDDIKAKVLSGYSLEDATFAVLGKAGKLGQPKVETYTPAAGGGSATTTLPPQGGDKSVSEMTQAERRAALAEAPDLLNILTPRSNQ